MNEQNNDIFGNVVPSNVVPEVNGGVIANSNPINNTIVNPNISNSVMSDATNNTVIPSFVPNNLSSDVSNINSVNNSNIDLEKTNVLNPVEVPATINNNSNLELGSNNVANGINNNISTVSNVVTNSDMWSNNLNDGMNLNVNDTVPSNSINSNNSSNAVSEQNDNIVSVKKYLGHILLFAIPVVGFVMLIVKALDKNDKNISNLAKAQLILSAIVVVISVVLSVVVTTFIIGTVNSVVDNIGDNSYVSDYDYNFDY